MPAENEQENLGNLSDIEIAELANKELKLRNERIATLEKELAVQKLYSVADDGTPEVLTREECIKKLGDSHITNYDYAQTVVNLVDVEKANGRQNPLGSNGENVYTFFKNVIEECGDDKSRFTSIYQARLGSDDPSITMAYNKRK